MSNKTQVINLSRDTTAQVEIRDKDNNLSSVQVMPRGKVYLPLSMTVDPTYLALNGSTIKVNVPTATQTNAPDAPTDNGGN